MKDLRRGFWRSMFWLMLGEALVISYLVTIYYVALPWWWSFVFFGGLISLAGLKKLIERDSLAAPIALVVASLFPLAQSITTYFKGVGHHNPMTSLETCKGLMVGAFAAPAILLVWYGFLNVEHEKTHSTYDVD